MISEAPIPPSAEEAPTGGPKPTAVEADEIDAFDAANVVLPETSEVDEAFDSPGVEFPLVYPIAGW